MVNEAFRALARVDRELWVITAQQNDASGQRRGGLLASWVQAVSLDDAKPALLIAIHPSHYTRELIDASGAFVAHLLRDGQRDLAYRFASSSGRDGDKWAGLPYEMTDSGAPRLRDCAAWVDCRVYARLATPDRVFYWADCLSGGVESTAPTLRESEFFRSLSPEMAAILRENRRADVESVAAQAATWKQNLPEFLRPAAEA
jgi:flavin reductase (DIM6/NTAB) family NADH-FMN oxidoreductase RutF